MIVIADTSPIRYLVLLDYSNILGKLYGRVVIPGAVARELRAQKTPATGGRVSHDL